LHCHNCSWSQDDFWSKDGYTPFRQDLMDDLKDALFKDKIYFDEWTIKEMGVKNNYGFDKDGHWVNGKEYVLAELKRKIKSIENMAVKTDEEWQIVRDNFRCPKCGSEDWDID
jgi:hypothetical protein